MKTLFTKLIVLLLFAFSTVGLNQAIAQTPGLIFQPATNGGQKVLDPNGDNYVSLTTAGFPAQNRDEGPLYSEIPYRPFPIFMNEPLHDILTGNSGSHTDYAPKIYENINGVKTPVGSPLCSYYDGTNFMFRVRLGGTSSASMGYSMLIDTDGKFPGGTPNPGFEFEVVFANNFDVRIYDHRTNTTGGDIIFQGSYKQYSQKSVASSMGDENPDYFYDFYVPLAAFKGAITPTTPLRMSGVTVTSAKSGIYGSISDVGGLNDVLYNGDVPGAWEDIINAFPPTSLTDIQQGEFPPAITTPPVVNGPLYTNSTVITGTSVEAPGSVITVYQNGVAIGTTVVNTDGTWSLPVPTGVTLIVGDKISATVKPVNKLDSGLSNIVIVQEGTCEETATPPITEFEPSGNKGFKGTTSYLGEQVFTIYRRDNSTGVITWEKFNVTTTEAHLVLNSSPKAYAWSYTFPKDKVLSAGMYYVTVTPKGLCESMGSNQVCYEGTGNPDLNSRIPTITTINGKANPELLFQMPLTSIGGTLSGSNTLVTLVIYKNDKKTAFSLSTSNFTWTINTPGIVLQAGDVITVKSEASSFCGTLSSIPSNPKIAAVRSTPPVITGSYCGTTTKISGTSTEAAGTRIRLYANGVLITSPAAPHATVTMQGYWTASNLNIPAGTNITATAIADGEIESAPSDIKPVSYQQAITGFSITGPVYENAVTVSGKAPSTTISGNYTVRLYINGVASSYYTSVFAANGDWTIKDIFAYDIYAGAELSIRVSSSNLCESVASSKVVVACNPDVRPITVSSGNNFCYNAVATVNLSSSISGAAYSLFINNVQTGSSVAGTGYAISLNSGPLTANPTTITVREIRIGSVCGNRDLGSVTVNVFGAVPANFTLVASPDSGCPNMSTTITVQNAQTGYSYQLINAQTKALIGTPVTPATSGNLALPVATVPVTTTFGVIVTNTTSGCSVENANTAKVTITGPDVTLPIWASNPVCAGSPATIFVTTQLGYTYTVYFKDNNALIGVPLIGDNKVQSVKTDNLSPARIYTYYVKVTGGTCNTTMLTEAHANVIDSGTLKVSAGEPQFICRGTATTASATLQGSDPSPGTGLWTLVTAPAGAPAPVINNATSRTPTVTNLVSGDYIFKWAVTTPCGAGESTVKITVNCPAIYQVVAPNYWDMFPNGSNLATAFDEDKGVVSATIVSGRIPAGSYLSPQGHIIVDNRLGQLETGNFYITIRTVDHFGGVTETPILIIIYPRNAAPTPMPVELIFFKAKTEKGDVVLHWETASEKDNDRFEIKRSADGKTFDTVGFVKGAGNSSQKNAYNFIDEDPLYGTSYYMLKQIDFDGKFSHSRMEAVNIKVSVANGILFHVFPNPFSDELNMTVTTDKASQAVVQVVDLQGRVISKNQITIEQGKNEYKLPIQHMSPGMYLVKVTGAGISYTTKVIKTQ